MVIKYSLSAEINSEPHFFSLKSTDGKMISINDCIMDNGLLICFICNHCPYVVGMMESLSKDIIALKNLKIGSVAIMPNDVEAYPADSIDNMAIFKEEHNLECDYLIDETQEIARAYGAQCTPEFYLYFRNCKRSCYYEDLSLKYRGRLCGGSPSDRDLYNFAAELVRSGFCNKPQKQSFGCSIKWKDF